MEELTAENVKKTILECLFTHDEMQTKDVMKEGKKVEGVVRTFVFNPDKLNKNKQKIIDMLMQLPHQFRKSQGGGWSFLNGCVDEEGNQWGEQSTVEALMCLGIAIDKVKYCLPREAWKICYGGVPYFVIDDDQNEKKTKEKTLHKCIGDLPDSAYGDAITECYEEDNGKLWAGNGEYNSQVNFCPYCGYKAKKQVTLTSDGKAKVK